jgi:hypothetical protein
VTLPPAPPAPLRRFHTEPLKEGQDWWLDVRGAGYKLSVVDDG